MRDGNEENPKYKVKKPSEGKLLYHLTKAANVPSILEKGLKPRSDLAPGEFEDIANQEIMEKRNNRKFGLDKSVLFHFFPRNPFDFGACYEHGPENMVFITIWRSLAEKEGKIIPRHPLSSDDEEIYDYAEGFAAIEWDILDDIENRNYSDQRIKSACMAECIIDRIIPSNEFAYIFVPTETIKQQIIELSSGIAGKVIVNPRMFPGLTEQSKGEDAC